MKTLIKLFELFTAPFLYLWYWLQWKWNPHPSLNYVGLEKAPEYMAKLTPMEKAASCLDKGLILAPRWLSYADKIKWVYNSKPTSFWL